MKERKSGNQFSFEFHDTINEKLILVETIKNISTITSIQVQAISRSFTFVRGNYNHFFPTTPSPNNTGEK